MPKRKPALAFTPDPEGLVLVQVRVHPDAKRLITERAGAQYASEAAFVRSLIYKGLGLIKDPHAK